MKCEKYIVSVSYLVVCFAKNTREMRKVYSLPGRLWMTEWIPQGQTVNQTYYLKVLAILREQVRKKWTPFHNALSVKRYLAVRGLVALQHKPYSPDLAFCYFFLFPTINSRIKGIQFESTRVVKWKLVKLLNALTKEDFHHCFDQWKNWMEFVRWGEGSIWKGSIDCRIILKIEVFSVSLFNNQTS